LNTLRGTLISRRFVRDGIEQLVICEVIDPYSEEFNLLLQNAPLFQKTAEVRVRPINPGSAVITSQASTQRTAQPGDVLIENPTGEIYLISSGDLEARYVPKIGVPGVYVSNGIVRAAPLTKHVAMEASWGELVGAIAGDFLAERPDTRERYFIERPAFDATFVRCDTNYTEQE
jgi:hypothetical protein